MNYITSYTMITYTLFYKSLLEVHLVSSFVLGSKEIYKDEQVGEPALTKQVS